MKMKIKQLFIPALAALTFFTSCENDDDINETPVAEGDYASGVFVLNEGVWNSGNSTVSFLDEETGTVVKNVFADENSGAALGDTGQSMGFYGDYAFIMVNVSNTLEVVDRNTFKSVATIDEGIQNPRYIAFAESRAYVTNWGDATNPDDDYVAVIDLESFTVLETISVEEGPEEILEENGNLYIALSGGYSVNNKITVIDASANEVTTTINVGISPGSMEIEDGALWVAVAGMGSYPDPEAESAGKIIKIDLGSNDIVAEFAFPNATDHPGNLDIENDMVYYTLGSSVYTFSEDATTLPEIAFVELAEVASLYGFEVENGKIYAASANADFTGDGDLFIYSTADGSLLNSYEVGINPNGVYFND
ncbi:hypothetical protein RM553_10740 [Zunongwangia sp. F363]|uniref:40-residue YVTN family beta-propeller repeat-containing protein n=1 Tax=Autumnicola tepida TaxID=3075595 RepID=A0ABU3CAE8_9FLAO|nr:DUF5074 domain-containing protein [Zunongwangia sp. F363]MDT0643306.1 hypothetical protein [Zunongwangia sp. F363]